MRTRQAYLVFVAVLLIFGNTEIFAQISNSGVKLFLDRNAVLYVQGNYKHDAGEVLNNGTITVLGDWKSNDKVFQDASVGTVVMNSVASNLSGTATFPNLVFKGNGTYQLNGKFDARLSLDIDDSIILLFLPEGLRLLNSNPLSLTRKEGYISSLSIDASFVRFMDNDEDYLYPMGVSDLRRFVVLKPKDANTNQMAVSFIAKDPNSEGFSRLSKTKSVGEINDAYYHKIKRMGGTSPFDVTFLMPSSEKFTGLAAWVRNIHWDRMISTNTVKSGSGAAYMAQAMLHKNANLPLGSEVPFALAQITNASPLEFYNAFSPDGDGRNDTWEIKNIDAFPDNDLKIFDRSGNLVYRMNSYNSTKYWDGKNVSSGTYIYILRVKIDGKDEHFKGSITMVKN
ncbi:gliding motility-associated C-terminal domain-containing protein [Pedobacter xixiisoli]|uniref:Gliding motility-associated C-terminal domain-containing protein n=1 Tax=Pedobacter xixiisoli TaxID=1476464 RepID=A0A285ZZD7_9SPHI|nr:gliding motility-associated C-terminal domain-containing protein [Pedobacter xixiisoli]SOD15019.1 gliding motility-associated C-terminal domain-containing protein [Pedobacter xixiisoli]